MGKSIGFSRSQSGNLYLPAYLENNATQLIRPSSGISSAPSAATLRAGHGFKTLGGGGGSQVNAPTADYTAFFANLVAGDISFLFVNSQWGCSAKPTQTPVRITDNIGNLWINIRTIMIDTGFYSAPAGGAAFQSKYQFDCLYCVHKGGALTTLAIVSDFDINAWDIQANTHISSWVAPNRVPVFVESSNQFNITNPSCPNFFSNTNRQCLFSTYCPSNGNAFNGAGGPGGFAGIDLATGWYALQKSSPARELETPIINLITGPATQLQSIVVVF